MEEAQDWAGIVILIFVVVLCIATPVLSRLADRCQKKDREIASDD